MARAAVPGRLTWQPATVAAIRAETATARTLVLDVDGWTGHVPGQHVDVRLTAPDGYTAYRSYSISSAPGPDRLEVTVQAVTDGEVSPYLVDVAEPGDQLEVRGPLGGWFVRRPADPRPALLIGGGSGVAPLMSMVRAATNPTRLLYSTRSPSDALFSADLATAGAAGDGRITVAHVYTRVAPPGWPAPPRRLDADALARVAWPRDADAVAFVCGPTGFVETVADLLVDIGHDPANIRTERFGPTGG
ncbi:ferredoxin reductase [Micromonospora cremea]|uniref:Ferredoxin-NADP reductase n=1 Tax=Micromonospora cremea TaxID=709881 RepID=A0A1N5UD55_9ACTN|nr:ferredoxin reductase [Micromonospora cremea]SIM58754.1 Ferredoxin-NADP reductase [Micromonospora cremea]